MKDETIKSRGKDSVWTTGTDTNHSSNGIRVKFACGSSAGGFLYPICLLVSSLGANDLPSQDFHVYEIEGLAINGHIDPRCEEVGYLCLMGSNVSQQRFFNGSMMKLRVKLLNVLGKK